MTSKELSYLEDTIKAEKQIVKKYQSYASMLMDANLKDLCDKAAKRHEQQYKTLLNNLNV